MNLTHFGRLSFITVSALLCIMLISPLAKANPLVVSWYITVTDGSGIPIDGALLTIYWSNSTDGPFTQIDSSIVEDRIADKYQNPVITGYWNPDHPHGMAVTDLHITNVENYCFYVKMEYDSTTEYWPQADSIKPGDETWAPVAARGSPSGYAASGNSLGNGPTTAYPNYTPPDNVVPEVPLGPTVATASMVLGLVGYVGVRRRKAIGFP